MAADVPALEALIPRSVHALQAAWYTPAQREAALGPVFGVDRQLIDDGTYFVAVAGVGGIAGCGGWSRRASLFGSDAAAGAAAAAPLDPARDAARIRAFFVDPGHARRGIGRAILAACEAAIVAAGFGRAELVATLAGEPLYAGFGYAAVERYGIPLRGGLTLQAVRMTRRFS